VKDISRRQEQIEEGVSFNPIVMFAEGGTSNGKHLISFKRGPFESLKTVRPVVLQYSYGHLSPAYDVIHFLSIVVFMMCNIGFYWCNLKYLPPFKPNEYLFETHKDKGQTKWEIYAWAVRELMAEHGELTKSD
jgi:hypothetical protein